MPATPVDSKSVNRSECGCLEVSTILANANLAMSDLTVTSYGSDTATTLPLEVCQTCLELLNTAGALTVAGAGTTGRRLLQTSGSVTATTNDATVCPNATVADPPLATAAMPTTAPPSATDDAYACPYNAVCSPDVSVLANDTTPNTNGLMVVTGVATPPPNGTLVLSANGSFTYTPIK